MVKDDELEERLRFQMELEAGKYTVTAPQLMGQIERIHKSGVDGGIPTGWECMDNIYRVKKGEMAIVSGNSGCGKSTFVDNLTMSLARRYGWKFSVFSPENFPYELHVRKLLEIHAGEILYHKQTLESGDELVRRMDMAKLVNAMRFVSEHYYWANLIKPKLSNIVEVWSHHIDKYNVDGVVLDPWNEVETRRPSGVSETDFISECLSMLREFARISNVAMWIVAHPAKTQRDKNGNYPVPSLNDIAGSYAWRAKADIGIIVHRQSTAEHEVDVLVQKVRFKTSGFPGSAKLKYEYDSGRMVE